jgi:hypothetical protein
MVTAKGISLSIAAAALLTFGACRNDNNSTAPAASNPAPSVTHSATLSPEDLGTLGARIQKNPNDATRILQDRGLTQEQFAAQVRKVAEDPGASKRYAAAFKNTKA